MGMPRRLTDDTASRELRVRARARLDAHERSAGVRVRACVRSCVGSYSARESIALNASGFGGEYTTSLVVK